MKSKENIMSSLLFAESPNQNNEDSAGNEIATINDQVDTSTMNNGMMHDSGQNGLPI